MSKPLVSVVMTVYNSEKWLSYSIESILQQTFKDFEFIIINDGSTDNSKEILDRYSKIDKRIKVIHRENKGVTQSIIEAINYSTGDFIAKIDSDDISSKNRLSEQIIEIRKKKLDLVSTNFSLIDEKGEELKYFDIRKNKDEILQKMLGGNSFFPHSSVMFRRQTYLKIGGYNSFFKKSQDIDLWIRFIQKNKKVGVCELNVPLTYIRIHNEQMTHKDNDDIFTAISILNYYSRKNNKLEITQYDYSNKRIIIDKIKSNQYYKMINLKNKIRFYKNNFFSKEILNITEILNEIFSLKLLKIIKLYCDKDIELYQKLASKTILKK